MTFVLRDCSFAWRSSFYLSAYPSENRLIISTEAEQFARIFLVDFLFVLDRGRDVVDDTNGFTDKSGTFFRIERHVGAEEHVVRAEESQAALGGRQGAEQSRVRVKHSKIVEGPFFETAEGPDVVFVIRAPAKLIQPPADAPFKIGNHGAHMMRDDF